MLKVAIVGASGYTGLELIRLLSNHPEVEITAVTSEQSARKGISSVFPSLTKIFDKTLEHLDADLIAKKADLIFTALPHQKAMDVVPHFLKAGKKVIDLSADFRIKDHATYGAWYANKRDGSNFFSLMYRVLGGSDFIQLFPSTIPVSANPRLCEAFLPCF